MTSLTKNRSKPYQSGTSLFVTQRRTKILYQVRVNRVSRVQTSVYHIGGRLYRPDDAV